MKRATYRAGKKKLEQENAHQRKQLAKDKVGFETDFTQETTEFNREKLRQTTAEIGIAGLADQDTNEIFFEKQRKRQWLWSGPSQKNNRLFAVIIIIVAVLLSIMAGPMLFEVLGKLLGYYP